MRITLGLLATLAVLATACTSAPSAGSGGGSSTPPSPAPSSPAPPADSGVEGEVVIAPLQPAATGAGNGQPVSTAVEVRTAPPAGRGPAATPGPVLARTTSDSGGRFRVALAPGSYEVVARSPSPAYREVTSVVVVSAHAFTTVVLMLDTGIR